MADYLHYWQRERFQLAFAGGSGNVDRIASAWYRKLEKGDVVWLITRGAQDKPVLSAKVVAIARSRQVRWPPYAVGNSIGRVHYQITTDPNLPSPIRGIPISWKDLRRLRFQSQASRIVNHGLQVYEAELASLRLLTDEASTLMTSWWKSPLASKKSTAVASAFGDPDTNPKVEKAAIKHVRSWYQARGWRVVSREADRIGYDLHCTKQTEKRLVEVKGRSNSSQQVILTAGEFACCQSKNGFELAIVTEVLSAPKLYQYTRAQVLSEFLRQPLAYQLTKK